MQIAKSAACQTFTASRRDNGTLIVVEKIEYYTVTSAHANLPGNTSNHRNLDS